MEIKSGELQIRAGGGIKILFNRLAEAPFEWRPLGVSLGKPEH